MFTHIISRKWQSGGVSLSESESISADGENNRDVNLAASVVNHPFAYALAVAQLQALYILCNQDTTLTPYDTSNVAMTALDLRANVPFEWTVGSGLDNPFLSDIGSMKATNLSSTAATLKIRSLFDSTSSNAVGS